MAESVLPQSPEEKRDLSRIVLPSRTPPVPPRRSPPLSSVSTGPPAQTPAIPSRRPPAPPPESASSPPLRLVPKPAGNAKTPSEVERNQLPLPDGPMASQAFAGVSVQPGPKKETARIAILSRTSTPAAIVQAAPDFAATSNPVDAFDLIPRWFCWGLLGLSALIFLIEIWNYALS